MREILFRGKREDNQWEYGNYCIAERLDKSGVEYFIIDIDAEGSQHYIIPETVGQYTGLTDKNGKRIFEEDIVKADDYIFVVKYGKCGGVANADNYGYIGFYLEAFSEATKLNARYGLRDDIYYFNDIEIIGNIHDNGDLLKGE